jgi:SAM-dependent methyltransferase
MINFIIWKLKKIYFKLFNKPTSKDTLQYRDYLHRELLEIYGDNYFQNKRILEIGPRDGEDSFRIEDFNPSEYVLIDLPDKEEINLKWLNNLKSNHKFIQTNFLYMTQEDYESLGKFDLIYFTGVLYHNPEQLRFIQKLYDKLNYGGV